MPLRCYSPTFFFNDTATTEIYTLSLHDALPISSRMSSSVTMPIISPYSSTTSANGDRKSTRLNSSHANISYAVFCLHKKKHTRQQELWRNGAHSTCDSVHSSRDV